MCGIVGSVNAKWVKDPLKFISHRGPDFQDSITTDNVFLGHTRLSILDLSDLGNQPMISPDSRFSLVYNGEIYNHLSIREELLKKGYKFKSVSDTETLLYSWIEWGQACVNRFNGIFAFAIFDKKKIQIIHS